MASSDYVTSLYKELLGRAPDAGGLKHYMGYSDPNEVRSSILGSAEYKSRQASIAQPKPAAQPAAKANPDPYGINKMTGELGTLYAQQQNPVDLYNKALSELGVSDARTRVTDLRTQLMNTEGLLKNVEADVSGRTQDSLVTEGQRRRIVAGEQQPLAEQVGALSGAFQGAQEDYQMGLGEAQNRVTLAMQADDRKRQSLLDRIELAIGQARTAEEKRQWELEYQRALQKDAEAKRQWEAEFERAKMEDERDYQLALRRGSGGGGGGGGSSSEAAKAAYDKSRGEIISFFDKHKGGDGYVSPNTFRAARRDWTAKGQDPSLFDSLFAGWANPSHIDDYL